MKNLNALIVLVLLALCVLVWGLMKPARAHSWYSDEFTIAGAPDWYVGQGCCYGEGDNKDCDPIPFASVREVRGGWVVTLTKAQMLRIRPKLRDSAAWMHLEWGISEFVPSKQGKAAWDAGYHVCLRQGPNNGGHTKAGPVLNWIMCFFFPTNS